MNPRFGEREERERGGMEKHKTLEMMSTFVALTILTCILVWPKIMLSSRVRMKRFPRSIEQLRSISLPARLHPTSLKIEADLDKLRLWEQTSASTEESLTAETIRVGLVGLAELYNSVEELIRSSLTQGSLLHHQDGKVLEGALDDSVKLLDTCGSAKDMLSKMKGCVQDIRSTLRRRGAESKIGRDIDAYISLRKKGRKEASSCIRTLKRAEKRFDFLPLVNLHHDLPMVVKVVTEVSTITSAVFRSLLLFLSMPVITKSKLHGCSLISKLRPTGFSFSEKEKKIMNEVGSVDAAFNVLHVQVMNDMDIKDEKKMAQKNLESLIVSIDGLEAGLDLMFRRLIQYRVSLLNVLTH